MLSPDQAFAFLLAALVVTASPGPDNLMVLSIGVARGRRAGMVFGLGCAMGCLNHTLLAVLGVSALVAASPWAFTALKLVGGLYLVWMGLQALRSRGGAALGTEGAGAEPLRKLFLKGLVANAINPKVVVFFLAFLPQFVRLEGSAAAGDAGWQMAQLGVLFTAQAAALFGLLGWFSGAAGQQLQRRPGIGLWLDRAAGAIFVGLGLRLMLVR